MEATNRRLNINTSIHLICEFAPSNDAINIKKAKQEVRVRIRKRGWCQKGSEDDEHMLEL